MTQNRNLGAGAVAEAMEQCLLLIVCSTCFRMHKPGIAPSTMGWALSYQSLNKKMPYRLVDLTEAFPQLRLPSFQRTSVYAKLP